MKIFRSVLIGLSLVGAAVVWLPSPGEAQPRFGDHSAMEMKYGPGWGVFTAIADSENLWPQVDRGRQIGDYLSVRRIDLTPGAETYLAEGLFPPFFGASKSMFWVVQRYPFGVYRVIAAIGAADRVIAGDRRVNGYRVLESHSVNAFNERWVSRMIYQGDARYGRYVDVR